MLFYLKRLFILQFLTISFFSVQSMPIKALWKVCRSKVFLAQQSLVESLYPNFVVKFEGEGEEGVVYKLYDAVGRVHFVAKLSKNLDERSFIEGEAEVYRALVSKLGQETLDGIFPKQFNKRAGVLLIEELPMTGHEYSEHLRRTARGANSVSPRPLLALSEVLSTSIALMERVSFLNQKGVYHMDLKTEKLAFGEDGSLKLLDPGAVLMGKSFHSPQMTIKYMAPELFFASKLGHLSPADRRVAESRLSNQQRSKLGALAQMLDGAQIHSPHVDVASIQAKVEHLRASEFNFAATTTYSAAFSMLEMFSGLGDQIKNYEALKPIWKDYTQLVSDMLQADPQSRLTDTVKIMNRLRAIQADLKRLAPQE